MGVSNQFAREAKQIWDNYYPFYTEASGCMDLGGSALCLLSFCRMKTSDDYGIDFAVTPQSCMSESATLFTRGLSKLALPIIVATAYLIYRSFA